ncbi:hypothetical protein EDD27_8983 [Nonomuraea polychroma]|uniref:Uncharacterized protein n=1 Tax=Nonomuraea polychroma TaxID=46176 RepID=A0A438MKK3_9ACTN|nr:hypothetical protein [Nonomuraea polychroma]RVX46131.1 hypothetical protein EDD27_8983 [Nonomuraea polychroma]
MPKFPDLAEYAAAIAPVIDAAHVNVHASALKAVTELAETSGVTPGLLSDLRFVFPLRPVTRAQLGSIYRYGEADVQEQVRKGTLVEDDGVLRPTAEGLEFIHRLYELHAAATERVWGGHDLPGLAGLAGLAGRVLDQAGRMPGGALEAVAPPYEPEGAAPGLLLFNRLAVLRYHRADAHAAAWQAAGLSVAEIVGLRDGPLRAGIETDTNLRAGAAYEVLSADERDTLYDGLLKLV